MYIHNTHTLYYPTQNIITQQQLGSGAQYPGSLLSAHDDAVVVNMNYRLETFGFAAFEEQYQNGESTGNFGLLDQQEAIKWVHEVRTYTYTGLWSGAISGLSTTPRRDPPTPGGGLRRQARRPVHAGGLVSKKNDNNSEQSEIIENIDEYR